MHEYWPGADNPPLDECLARVDGCDLLLAIVARRHGWTPAGQAEGEFKSITRLECERANGRVDIIPFFVDETASWPEDKTEDYRLTAASLKGEYDEIPKLAREIPRNKLALEDFRQWLSDGRQRRLFANPEQLRLEIHKALTRWRGEHPEFQSAKQVPGFDPAGYRHWLQRRCESVELLGLDPKDAMNTRLQQVYVPARVAWDNPDPAQLERLGILMDDQHDAPDRRRIELPLLHRLSCESLYVPGSPGAGKTTFCRWLALVAAAGQLPAHPIPTPDDFSETLPADLQGRLPVLCHLRDLNDHRDLLRGSGRWNRKQLEDALAAWLDRTQPGELTGNAWRALMDRGDCLLILDGVDELQSLYRDGPQSHRPRANFLSGLADALPAWQRKNNCVLLTSRPYGLGEADRRRLGLTAAELLPLKEPLQHCFIRRWYAAVDPAHAEEKSEGLIAHLDERADLSELQQSPMLLTALCVKYDEGRRLPRDFHLLYHSVIGQVLHGRYPETTDQQAVRRRLAAVALGMHTGDAVTQERSAPEAAVSYDELDRILAAYAGEEPASEGGANRAAEKREDLISRSGLLLPRGEEKAAFYHLSFQEYLAAERLQALDCDLADWLRTRAAAPEWRRTLRFLFCSLAEKRPQAALDQIQTVLLPALDAAAIRENPNPAWLLLDCLEIAHARGWAIDVFTERLMQICDQSLATDFPEDSRNQLWLAAGKLGADRRPGVGLTTEGLPDIQWCPVAGGTVMLEDGAGTFSVSDFAVAQYPVTNAQFQAFVDAGDGYRNPDWWEAEWLDAGWVNLAQPVKPSWTEPNAPRESVSWFEAVAFARWLDHRLRRQGELTPDRQVRLPTEWEWQLAATGGDSSRTYPWGRDWQPTNLNAEMGLDRTSAVGLYPPGRAPCGASDMAGNVWEWCLNSLEEPGNTTVAGSAARTLRGGSWIYDRNLCRAACRSGLDPNRRYGFIGLRLCCSSPIDEDRSL